MLLSGKTTLLAGLGALAAFAAGPAAAAPVLNPLKPCYVSVRTSPEAFNTEEIVVGGTGFTPGGLVDVSVDGAVVAPGVVVDANGALPAAMVDAPAVPAAAERLFTVTAAERADAAQTVSLDSLVSDLSVVVRPRRARPSRVVRFSGHGFTAGGPVYAHYLRRGVLRRTVRLARTPAGACGRFSVRRRQFPFNPRTGAWTLQIDQQRAFGKIGPLVRLAIDVKRTARTRR